MASRADFFGTLPDGREVHSHRLIGEGIEVEVLDYGGIVRSVRVADAVGSVANVVLGLETLAQYRAADSYLGAIVGRCANRIRDGRFVLDGVEHRVTVNDPPSSVHGGAAGFDRKLWSVLASGDRFVELEYVSLDGEEGLPR